MLLLSKLNIFFLGYFDPKNKFLDNRKTFFGDDLTDNSAKKEALRVFYILSSKSLKTVQEWDALMWTHAGDPIGALAGTLAAN